MRSALKGARGISPEAGDLISIQVVGKSIETASFTKFSLIIHKIFKSHIK